jgi:tetratricopeptide (TPR) repeat protein
VRALPVVIVMLLAAPALAQGDDAKTRAKAAFERAVTAEHAKDWHRAIDEFQQAYDILPRADVLYNIAVDLERLEEYRDAATFYRRYLDDKQDAEDRDKVEQRIDNLRGRAAIVRITSDPPGAQVSVDGAPRGQTPLEVKLAGAHHVELVDGSATWSRDVTVEFGEDQALDATLTAKQGSLAVSSNVAGAHVSIDGEDAGVTPLDVHVSAGTHQIVVSAPTWSTYQRTVDVPAEGQAQVTANLVHPLGYVPPETPPPTDKSYYFAFSAGADVASTAGGAGALMFGAHNDRWDAAIGYGYMNSAAMFEAEVRLHLLLGAVRPYLRGAFTLGSVSAGYGGVGLLAHVGASGRAQISLFGDASFGWAKFVDKETGDTATGGIVPITGGVQIAY